MSGEIGIGKVAGAADKGLVQNLIVEIPFVQAMSREKRIPKASMIEMGLSGERGHIDRKSNAMVVDAMVLINDISLSSALGHTWKQIQKQLHSIMVSAESFRADRA